jgi:hypothetical protein|tara:strand:- start:592 stop:810 length:219 start_codon:yes stop_codon:yes gene_type:complete
MEAARDLVALRTRWGRLRDYKAGRPQTSAGQENQGGTVLSFDSCTCAMKKLVEQQFLGGLRDQPCSVRATMK